MISHNALYRALQMTPNRICLFTSFVYVHCFCLGMCNCFHMVGTRPRGMLFDSPHLSRALSMSFPVPSSTLWHLSSRSQKLIENYIVSHSSTLSNTHMI